MFAIPCLLLFAAVPDEHPSAAGIDGDFELEARILEMVEGGPLVVEAILTYKGFKPVEFYQNGRILGPNAKLKVPDDWKNIKSRGGIGVGSPGGTIRMQTGEQRQEVLHLHEHYTGIKAGKIKLPVSWPVNRAKGDQGNLILVPIADPKIVFELDIPPATPDRLRRICEGLEKRFDKVGKSNIGKRSHVIVGADAGVMELQDIGFHFLKRSHAEFIPLSLKFLEMNGYMKAPSHVDYIIRTSNTTADAHRLFVDQVTRDRPTAIAPYFQKWNGPKWNGTPSITAEELPDEEIRRLERAPDLWVRALTYVTLGKRCEPAWVTGLLAELEHSRDPLNPKALDDLVLKLDSPSFRVREDAQRELLGYGFRVRDGLKKALSAKPSLEVQERIGKLLEQIDKMPTDPRDIELIEWFRPRALQTGQQWPERCREVLEALTRADRSSWIAVKAQNLLAGKPDRD
jgi:hypothetical protein